MKGRRWARIHVTHLDDSWICAVHTIVDRYPPLLKKRVIDQLSIACQCLFLKVFVNISTMTGFPSRRVYFPMARNLWLLRLQMGKMVICHYKCHPSPLKIADFSTLFMIDVICKTQRGASRSSMKRNSLTKSQPSSPPLSSFWDGTKKRCSHPPAANDRSFFS